MKPGVVHIDWGEIFGDTMMAAAILDPFPYRATVLHIDGDSYHARASRARREPAQGVTPTNSG